MGALCIRLLECFVHNGEDEIENRELLQSSLFSTPSIQGNFLLLPNESGEDSEINLELLFNATLAVPERISALFHSKQTEL